MFQFLVRSFVVSHLASVPMLFLVSPRARERPLRKPHRGRRVRAGRENLIVLINTNWMRKNALETSSWCCNNGEEDNNWKAMRISSAASRNFIQSVVWNAAYLQVVLIPSQIVLTKVCNQFHYTRFSITLESSSCLHFESLCLSREIRTEHTNFEGSSPFALRIKKFFKRKFKLK